MKYRIVIFTGFNRALFPAAGYTDGVHNALTEPWIRERFNIWIKHTWPSIRDQTDREWVYCMCCNKDAKAITDRYFGQVNDKRFYLTYSETDQERNVMKFLANGVDEIVNVRIDSDDMFHPKAIESLREKLGERENWFYWKKGYGYNYNGHPGSLLEYKAHGSGPFFAHRYRHPKLWLSNGRIAEQRHTWVMRHKPLRLKNGMVLVGLGQNSTTISKSSVFKCFIKGIKKERILKEFSLI